MTGTGFLDISASVSLAVLSFFNYSFYLLYCECVSRHTHEGQRTWGGVSSFSFHHVGSEDEIQHRDWLTGPLWTEPSHLPSWPFLLGIRLAASFQGVRLGVLWVFKFQLVLGMGGSGLFSQPLDSELSSDFCHWLWRVYPCPPVRG